MPWGRLDDGLYDHPKVDALPDRVRLACVGLYALSISYANRYMTDGFVPMERIKRLGGKPALVSALLSVGMFDAADRGIQIHDFLVYNQSRMSILADREVARRRAAMNANPALQRAIRDRDGNVCRYCGVTVNWRDRRGADGGTYDHVLPVSDGGLETVENLVVCCRSCNERKGPRTPEQSGMPLLDPGQKPARSTKPVSSRNPDTPTRPDPAHIDTTPQPPASGGRRTRARDLGPMKSPTDYDEGLERDDDVPWAEARLPEVVG